MKRRSALHQLALMALCTWLATGAQAASERCQAPADVQALQLQGQWMVQVTGQPRMWLLQLGPHPEHSGSLRGELNTGTARYPVVADLDDGEFTLEESHDGQRIAATWQSTLTPESCDHTLRGERQAEAGPATPFVMRRNQTR